MWNRIIWLFILFILGKHVCFPASPRYLELADSADYYISKEIWDKAEEKIIEALRLEPASFTNSLLLANLGMVQSQKGELLKAIETLSTGLNMAPSSTVLLNNRAHSFLLLENIESAILDLDKSLSIDSIQEWTLQTRAFLYLSENDLKNSENLLDKLKKEFPENASVYSGYGALYEKKGDYNSAINNYKKALSIDPDDVETKEALIFLLIKKEDYSQARSIIRSSIEKDPENPFFYLLRGYLHRLNYRLDEAQADKKIAISKGIDPEYASAFIP